jgi:WD40 repeat protein
MWEVKSGKLQRTLDGHKNIVWCVAFDPDGRTLVSGSYDKTIKIWEPASGKLFRTLEGHTGSVVGIGFLSDGSVVASKGGIKCPTIRLWKANTGICVGIIPELSIGSLSNPVFCQRGPFLATVGSDPASNNEERDNVIHIWKLDWSLLCEKPGAPTVTYTSAKVVLVGDTGVGKSGLAERLVRGRFLPTESSHARRAHVLDSQVIKNLDKARVHREIVLWDLAGQPAYRLVHQLSMEDAALACVLFDARSETNPFEGATYWSQVLDQASTNTRKRLIKFLVASRSDMGGLPAGADRIDAFVRENGFAGFFKTSAKTGQGCDELLQAIRQAIPWNDLPSVSSPEALRKLRDFVAGLNPARAVVKAGEIPALMTISELLRTFEISCKVKVPLEEFITSGARRVTNTPTFRSGMK